MTWKFRHLYEGKWIEAGQSEASELCSCGDPCTGRHLAYPRSSEAASIPDAAWEVVEELTRLRNLLVHEDGRIVTPSAEAEVTLLRRPGLSVRGQEIELSPAYAPALSRDLRQLIEHIQEGVRHTARGASAAGSAS